MPSRKSISPDDMRCGDRRKILIVEDEALIAMECEFILTEAQHEVVGIAATEEDALRIAEARRPDLVLMDIRLAKGGNGIVAAKKIHERWGIRSIFVSAHAEPETYAVGASAKPIAWVTKPYSPDQLLTAVDEYHG